MAAAHRKSKRRSDAGSRPETEPVFFLDRNLGRFKIATALRRAGARVEIHDDHFVENETDPVIIRTVSERGWIMLTKDEWVLRREEERRAIRDSEARIFMPTKRKGTGDDWARIFAIGLGAMVRFARKHAGPFAAKVSIDETGPKAKGKVHRIDRRI